MYEWFHRRPCPWSVLAGRTIPFWWPTTTRSRRVVVCSPMSTHHRFLLRSVASSTHVHVVGELWCHARRTIQQKQQSTARRKRNHHGQTKQAATSLLLPCRLQYQYYGSTTPASSSYHHSSRTRQPVTTHTMMSVCVYVLNHDYLHGHPSHALGFNLYRFILFFKIFLSL